MSAVTDDGSVTEVADRLGVDCRPTLAFRVLYDDGDDLWRAYYYYYVFVFYCCGCCCCCYYYLRRRLLRYCAYVVCSYGYSQCDDDCDYTY